MSGLRIQLSGEQQAIHDKVVKDRKNLFITGCGGTGKSVLVEHIVSSLRTIHGSDESVAVTGSTGRAAFNIRGCTFHSFAGIGLGVETIDVLLRRVQFNPSTCTRWKRTRAIVLDEVSMVDGKLFDKVETIARELCDSTKPFGGIQLILVGDLLQLPPVNARGDALMVFQADSWSKCISDYAKLSTVHRQANLEFVKALTCIRLGSTNGLVDEFMKTVSRPVTYEDGLLPVNLYASKARTNAHNAMELDKLNTKEAVFKSRDRGRNVGALDSCPAPDIVKLKVGCQVMLVKNLSKHLVNGSVGTVLGFSTPEAAFHRVTGGNSGVVPLVRFTMADGKMFTKPIYDETWEIVMPNGTVQCSRTQIPLILSWAMTIHKSQGHTIQRLRVDLAGVFEKGQTYTALSRSVGPDTLEVVNYSHSSVKIDVDTVNFCIRNDLI